MTDLNVSTKDRVGDYDAIESAKPGEPLFPIQGGDPLGPPTVQFWADSARAEARRIMGGGRAGFEPDGDRAEYQPTDADQRDADRLLRKATNAERVSWEMKAYQRGDVQPEDKRASYNDLPDILTVDAADAAAKRKASIAMVGQLNNAIAIAHGVSAEMDRLGLHPIESLSIDSAVDALELAAKTIEPRRENERS